MFDKEVTECVHIMNSNFLNRCFAVKHAPFIRNATAMLFDYFQPSKIMGLLIIILLVLPFIFKNPTRNGIDKTKKLYNLVRFTFLSLFHRITYVFTIVPWVSFFIAERGPCQCNGISTPYNNFPYAYSIASVISGLALFEFASFKPIVLYPIGLILIIVPSLLYVLGGWVSIGQALSSTLIAVFLHYFSILTTSYVTLAEDVVLFICNAVTLFWSIPYDTTTTHKKSPSIIHGMGALIYDFFLTLQFLRRNDWSYGNVSHENVVVAKSNTALQSTLVNSDESASYHERMKSDSIDGVVAFIIILVFDSINMITKSL